MDEPAWKDEKKSIGELLKNETGERPEVRIDREDAIEHLLDGMKQIERDIIIHYYLHGSLLKEIATLYGLSECRICEIRKGIFERLAKRTELKQLLEP